MNMESFFVVDMVSLSLSLFLWACAVIKCKNDDTVISMSFIKHISGFQYIWDIFFVFTIIFIAFGQQSNTYISKIINSESDSKCELLL